MRLLDLFRRRPVEDKRQPQPIDEASLSAPDFFARYLETIERTSNPGIIAAELGILVARGLRHGHFSLYEAYLLNMEALRFARKHYMQPAYQSAVHLGNLLAIMNQRLMAIAYGDDVAAQLLLNWAREAKAQLKESRPHVVVDRFEDFLDPGNNEAMEILADLRRRYDSLSEDDGPYPIEKFPFEACAPELLATDEALRRKTCTKDVGPEAGKVLVTIGMLE